MKPYQNLSCSLYDTLEAFATKKEHVKIEYRTDSNRETVEAIIVDLFSKDGAEFLKLNNNFVIRLDDLLSVNDIAMNERC